MKKPLVLALAAAAVLATGAAHAGGNVFWSIGISAPPVATVISNAPGYYAPAPVYSYPPPVIYTPPPVVYTPAPRVYYPPQVVYERPAPIYYRRHHRDRDHDGIPDRYDNYDNRQGWYGQYRDRDRDGVPDRYDRYDNRRYGY